MSASDDKVLLELEALKKLAILDLLGKGYSQTQIALTLGIGQGSVSKMFPKGVLGQRKTAKGSTKGE